ncbi:MAG: hypothetical protein U0704_10430 [Candidatus Eisenbacteria bacterium]
MNAPGPLDDRSEELLARYRAGAMTAAERAAFEREALADDALSEALYSELALDGFRRGGRPKARVVPLFVRVVLPIAACVALVSVWALSRRGEPVVPPAGDTVRGAGELRALAPLGTLAAAPESLVWSTAAGADAYRVELFAPSGRTLGSTVTRDTAVAIATLVRTAPDSAYWRVVPLGPDGLDLPAKARGTYRVRPR